VFSARACIQHYCTCQPNEFNNVVSHLWKSKSLRIRVSTDVSSAAGTDPILIKVLLICWAYLNPSLEKACFLFYGSLRSPSQIDRDHGRLRAVCFKELAIKTVRKTFDFFSYLVSRCNGKILDRHVWLYSFPVGLIRSFAIFLKCEMYLHLLLIIALFSIYAFSGWLLNYPCSGTVLKRFSLFCNSLTHLRGY